MMRLPPFRYLAPKGLDETIEVLAGEGPRARIVAGGTDLYPNMKRRHQRPETVVSVRRVGALMGIDWAPDGGLRIGAGQTLRSLERDARLRAAFPALWTAVRSISTPVLRTMGTIGGNVCLDTRCNYYDQSWEWRRAIGFCMKCDGDTCWVAPSSPRCWAVNSSDSVPVLIALGATLGLRGPEGDRVVPAAAFFRDDGIDYLGRRPGEVLVDVKIPAPGGSVGVYRKVRRRGSFDFPVAAVAVTLCAPSGRVESARVVLNAVGSAPVVCEEGASLLLGKALTDEVIEEAATRSWRPAKPLDNTDHEHMWRKKMIKVEIRRALEALRDQLSGSRGVA